MTTTKCYSREVRERAVNLVLETQHEHDSQWKAILSIAPKIGCIPETLRLWIKQQEQRLAVKNNLNADERQWIKVLERENRELRRSNDILRQAAAYLPSVSVMAAGDMKTVGDLDVLKSERVN
ncbi:IS3 family transposase, partial [Sodalis-like symbiont of Philaenus spumarius]